MRLRDQLPASVKPDFFISAIVVVCIVLTAALNAVLLVIALPNAYVYVLYVTVTSGPQVKPTALPARPAAVL